MKNDIRDQYLAEEKQIRVFDKSLALAFLLAWCVTVMLLSSGLIVWVGL